MRLRIVFSKSGPLRYIGHLDLQSIWERTIRRSGLPLAYTHGFHPGPKIQIAAALPLGFLGRAEIVDIWLAINEDTYRTSHEKDMASESQQTLSLPQVAEIFQAAAPPGLTIRQVDQVDESAPALQTQVVAAEFMVTFLDEQDWPALEHRIEELLARDSIHLYHRDKPYDLRSLVESLSFQSTSSRKDLEREVKGQDSSHAVIFMRLTARPGATGRPDAVLEVLGIPLESVRIERIRLILS